MAAVRRGSRVLGRTYSQVKLEIGYESAPGAFVSEAASLSHAGASTATQAALMLSAVALTNLPAGFSTLPCVIPLSSAYCSSTNPIAPGLVFTLSAISALRSAGSPTGHLG